MHIIIILVFNNLPKMWITRYWGKWWSFEAWCIYILHLSHVQFLTVAYGKWSFVFILQVKLFLINLHAFILLEIFKYQLLMYFRQNRNYFSKSIQGTRLTYSSFLDSFFSFNIKNKSKTKLCQEQLMHIAKSS